MGGSDGSPSSACLPSSRRTGRRAASRPETRRTGRRRIQRPVEEWLEADQNLKTALLESSTKCKEAGRTVDGKGEDGQREKDDERYLKQEG